MFGSIFTKSMIVVLLLSVCLSASNVKLARADGPVYIKADGSIEPSTAPVQRNGEVYSLTYNITSDADGIVVERDNITIDGSGFVIEGRGTYGSHGICLEGRSNVTIQTTSIENFSDGIELSSSSGNSVVGNTITYSYRGIMLNSSSGNSIGGNDLAYNNYGYSISLISSSNNRISGNSIANNYMGCGISLISSSNDSIVGNAIIGNYRGIMFDSSFGNSINGNNIVDNAYCSIAFSSSSNNSISGNFVKVSNYNIELYDFSSFNIISGNTITDSYDGVGFSSSFNNRISGNIIEFNYYGYGISLISSSDNRIVGNTVAHNDYGIGLYDSQDNIYSHNNLIKNTVQVNNVTPEQANFWGICCEGNYWSNYNGTDVNDDGVGDTCLPWEGVDYCPLVNVYWNPGDINHDLKVDMKDIRNSAGAYGTHPCGEGAPLVWESHADITGPEPLIPDGKVDMRDISQVARHFGEHYS